MAVEKPVLTQEQQDAVAALASTNVYAKQSKFKTFRELPPKDKWPYFKQNFLTDVLIIIAVVGLVLAFVISYVTKGPEAELSLEGVDMAEYSEQIDALGADFVKTQGIEDERLVRTDASIAISENAAQDGSASLTARVSAGQINMIVAETDIFAEVNDRGDITKPAEVMSAADLEQVKDAGRRQRQSGFRCERRCRIRLVPFENMDFHEGTAERRGYSRIQQYHGIQGYADSIRGISAIRVGICWSSNGHFSC